ncbi:MAG TPA: hypothetical protein VH079_03170 [Terriglobales bacterium]|nr:hypothetical protein [Terriglobales bacterium]
MPAEGMRVSVSGSTFVATLVVGIVLLLCPSKILAQHGGGGGGGGGRGGLGGAGRPTGVSPKDDLKDFHRLVALQATPEQKAMFARIVEDAQSVGAELKSFRDLLPTKPADLSDLATSLQEAIDKARSGNQGFIGSFSPEQKSGLKDITKKLVKTDSDLAKQSKELTSDEHTANSVEEIDKALANLQSGEAALGNEMSIVLPSAGEGLAWNLPPVTNTIEVAGQSIAISASGTVAQTSAEDDHNFSLKLTADLSDLQREIADILRTQLSRSPRCGERFEIQNATLTPLGKSGIVTVHLHYERWFCAPGQGSEIPSELVSGDGSVEIKLTASVEQNISWHLVSEIGRVDGDGFLHEMLSSGILGNILRDQISASVLSILQKGTNLKTALPPSGQGLATTTKAQFEDDGAGRLSLVLEDRLLFSSEQAKQFTTQLKQSLSAQTSAQ